MVETVAHVCELRDTMTRTRFWNALGQMAVEELPGKHWTDIGVEHWHFLIGNQELLVCEDYGELNIYGSQDLIQRVVAVTGGHIIG